MRHQEYLERQAARAARDDTVKPVKFEHEVSRGENCDLGVHMTSAIFV